MMSVVSGAPGLLIIEDDEAFRHALVRAAIDHGFTPFACDEWSAIEKDLAYSPPLVGAILDLRLPAGTPNGLSVGRMLTGRWSTLRIVFMTSAPELGEFVPEHLGPVVDKRLGVAAILQPFEDLRPARTGEMTRQSMANR